MTYKKLIILFSIISYILILMAILSLIFDNGSETFLYILFSSITEVRIHLYKVQQQIKNKQNVEHTQFCGLYVESF